MKYATILPQSRAWDRPSGRSRNATSVTTWLSDDVHPRSIIPADDAVKLFKDGIHMPHQDLDQRLIVGRKRNV